MNIQNMISFCQFVLKILSKTEFWHESRALTLLKFAKKNATIYNTNVDLVNDDEHTKFGLILSISSQEKPNYDIN